MAYVRKHWMRPHRKSLTERLRPVALVGTLAAVVCSLSVGSASANTARTLLSVCPKASKLSALAGTSLKKTGSAGAEGAIDCVYTNQRTLANLSVTIAPLDGVDAAKFHAMIAADAKNDGVRSTVVHGLGAAASEFIEHNRKDNSDGTATTVVAVLVRPKELEVFGSLAPKRVLAVARALAS